MMLFVRQVLAIFKKNFKRNLSNKKALIFHLIFPIVVSLIFYVYKTSSSQADPLKILLNFLLTIYIGLISSSTIKQTITLFVNERQQGCRQYQYVMGLCKRVHTLGNVFYMMVFTSVFLFPFYVVVVITQGKIQIGYIFTFAAFVVSTNFLTIALTSLFNEHKVATEVIGIAFSMFSFLPFVYNADQYNFKHYLAIIMPNSSFTLAILSKQAKQRFQISFSSLIFAKFYLLFFYIVEFREDFLQKLKKCISKCKKIIGFNRNRQNQMLMNQQIQVQASPVLSSSQTQNQIPRQSSSSVQLAHVSKHFGKVVAVDDVNIKFYKAEILGLLGRNGAGKTTMVDMITKVTKPTHGKIKFNYNKQNQDKDKTSVGICYQHQILYEDLTGIDHLRFYCQIKNVLDPESEIDKIVNKVGIRDEIGKKVKQLSGGNKRKLSFSIALLNQPRLLIFDEPTSGLDPSSRRNVWQILQQLRSSDTTIILTTHHLDEADHLSDRICIIKKGKIIQQGTPSQIKQKHGRGFYLTIFHNPTQSQQQVYSEVENRMNSQKNSPPFNIKHYTKILAQNLGQKQVKIIDKSKQTIKYFINKNASYKDLIKSIEMLEKIDGITVSMQANSLEQSFIALNIEDSDQISLQSVYSQQSQLSFNNKQESNSKILLLVYKIYGIVLKNFYCYIHKFHYLYNLNLIILIFITAINSLLISKLIQSQQFQKQIMSEDMAGTQKQLQQSAKTNPFFLIQGYIIMSSAFMAIPVLEKEDKIIQLLRTRGVSRFVYWSGQFIFDFIQYWINYLVLRILFYQIVSEIPLSIIALTGVATILYSYTFSLIFNKVKTANNWFTIINYLSFLLMIPLMLPSSVIESTFYRHFIPLKYLSPFFDVSLVLLKSSSQFFKDIQAIVTMQETVQGGKVAQNRSEQETVVQYCLMIYFVVFVAFQCKIPQIIINKIKKLVIRNNQQIQAREEVREQIKLEQVCKKYGKIQALRNVNYKINEQRVALLGHNGAGKSTTFGLLSSQLNSTSGNIYLQNKLKTVNKDVMKSAGICYQQDTLWKFMTASKILKVFGYLTGVLNQQKHDQLFESLDIQIELKDRKFQNLSGGNKRKVCMAVCLMGEPNIKLLDQCSTGLDPVSRLSMMNTLKRQNNGTIIFTTHSIPEAQQVCSRAIIMKKGQVYEDNKIYKLKQKYYNSYFVQFIFNNQTKPQLLTNQNLSLICVKIFESLSPSHFQFNDKKNRLQLQKSVIKLSQLMRALYRAKAKQIIKDFNIDEPKLEDIYLQLTADQVQQGQINNRGQQVIENDRNRNINGIQMREMSEI